MTSAARALFGADPDVVVWWATEVECVSAIARRERERSLSRSGARAALGNLDDLARTWSEIDPAETIRRTARRLLRVHPLRAADALQLAAAIVGAGGDPASLDVVTADEHLAEAAHREGFSVLEPEADG